MKTRKLVYTAILAAIGVLLPQVFHLIAGKTGGAVFLPMHIPAFLAGLLVGPVSGIVVGVISPLLSAVLTGMPTFEKMPFMMLELMTYGAASGILYKRYERNLYISLLISMIAGRIVNIITYLVAGSLLHMEGYSVLAVGQAVWTGVPGIVIQLIMIPLIVVACKKVVKSIG